ncbi:MAG: 2,3-butanediol dehydrogenase [Mycobacterium sp.]
MKALRFHGKKDLRLEDIPEPEIKPGHVKIRVEWCGICGTDLHEYLGGPILIPEDGHPHPLTGESLPVTMGHEFTGRIVEIAPDVAGFAVGDPVIVEPNIRDNTCHQCTTGSYNLCPQGGFYGLSGWGGGLAEYAVIDARNAYVLPPTVSTDVGVLIDPLVVAWQAMLDSGYAPGQTAIVIGAGPIGLALVLVLKASGARWIGVSEVSAARKAQAAAFGADEVFDPMTDDVPERVRERTQGLGAHVSFDCSGLESTLRTAIASVRPKGTAFNVAIWEGPTTIDMNSLVTGGKKLASTLGFAGVHPSVISALDDGRIKPADMITARIALEDIVEAGFDELIRNKDQHIKIIVHP